MRQRPIWSRLIAALFSLCIAGCSADSSSEKDQAPAESLVIYSTTDEIIFKPLMDDFRALHPSISLDYRQLEAAELDSRFRAEEASGQKTVDLLLSSAMDLQIKLVNDGYGTPHYSANLHTLPNWTKWRGEAISFTYEPIAMVFNTQRMRGRAIPQSRSQLLDAIRADPDFWRNNIAITDAATSSVAYLITSQDARFGPDFGALAEAFRDMDRIAAATSLEVLKKVEKGDLAMGYNVLGSYARNRASRSRDLAIIYPMDYTLVVSRTAVIPKTARNPALAHAFLDYLISRRGQTLLRDQSDLSSVRMDLEEEDGPPQIPALNTGSLRPIALGPGLLVYLDQQKRERLLHLWSGITANEVNDDRMTGN